MTRSSRLRRTALVLTLAGSQIAMAATYDFDQSTDFTESALLDSSFTGLNKAGTGTLTLTNAANSFTGTISITEGVLAFTSGSSSDNSALGASTTAILLDGGTLRYTGTTSGINLVGAGTSHPLSLGVNGGTIEANSNRFFLFGTTADIGLVGDGARTLTLGGNATDVRNKVSLRLRDQGGATSLVKTGSSTWIVDNSANDHSGSTTINQGRLQLQHATTFQNATGGILINGGILSASLNTTVGGDIVLNSGGIDTQSISGSTGFSNMKTSITLTDDSGFTMTGGTWTVDVLADGSTDQIISGSGTGAFSITGGALALRLADAGTFDYGDTYSLLSSFTSGFVSGLTITGYDTDNWLASLSSTGVLSFSSTAIPEPSTASLLTGAIIGLCVLGRRRRRA